MRKILRVPCQILRVKFYMTKFEAFICRTHLHCILRVEFYKQNLRVEFYAEKVESYM